MTTSTDNGTIVKSHKIDKKLISILPTTEDREIPAERSTLLTLYVNPADMENSTKYKVNARIIDGDESIEQLVRWRSEVRRILHGLGATTYDTQKPLMEMLMVGTPLANFLSKLNQLRAQRFDNRRLEAPDDATANAIDAAGIEHADNVALGDIQAAIDDTLKQQLPHRVLPRVRRCMRRECRKPADVKVRRFHQQLQRLNHEVPPNLPPFHVDQSFDSEGMLDIMLYATPKGWQREMERQGFDPMLHELGPVVDFMERLESTEDFDPSKSSGKKDSKKKSPPSRSSTHVKKLEEEKHKNKNKNKNKGNKKDADNKDADFDVEE